MAKKSLLVRHLRPGAGDAGVQCYDQYPQTRMIKTGPTQTDEISVAALPAGEVADLRLEFGAGELTINPGDQDMLVKGTATYNVDELKPEVYSERE